MKRGIDLRFLVSAVVLALLIVTPAMSDITCQEAITKLIPCQSYLVGTGSMSTACCEGAQSLNQLASTKPDRQAVCVCLKKVAPAIGVQIPKAQQLPQLCHIDIPVNIDPSIDCNTVPF